jgi:hypothetical protein
MNYFICDKRDLSPAYVNSCEKFLHNLKLKAAARPPKSSLKLQASSALKQTQLKGKIKT